MRCAKATPHSCLHMPSVTSSYASARKANATRTTGPTTYVTGSYGVTS